MGARWRTQLKTYPNKGTLLGRQTAFAITTGSIIIPSQNRLIDHGLADGNFFKHVERLPGEVAQVVGADTGGMFACLVNSNKVAPSTILFTRGATHMKIDFVVSGHDEPPWRLKFSPFSERLISCSDDGTIRLWDAFLLGRHGIIATFPGYKPDDRGNPIRGEFVDFSADNRWLATVYESRIAFRKPADGHERLTWEPEIGDSKWIQAIRFTPSGKSLLAFFGNMKSEDGTPSSGPSAANAQSNAVQFLLYHFGTKEERRFEGMHTAIYGTATRDGKHIVTWNGSPEVIIWDTESRREIATLAVSTKKVYDVTLTPAGDAIVTAGDDGEVKFWNVADHKQLDTKLKYKHDGVDQVQFSPDGKYLVTAGSGWLKVWDAPDLAVDHHVPVPVTWIEESDPNAIIVNGVTQRYQDGSTVTAWPDGRVCEVFHDGTVKNIDAAGNASESVSDGSVKNYKQY